MKPIFNRLLSGILSVAVTLSAVPIISAHAEESPEMYPYTLFAASYNEGAITINADNTCVNGNIAANGTIVSSGSAIVGEAGAELIEMPTGARVTPLDKNDDFGAKLDSIVEMMEKFMPLIGQGQLVLDTGTLVGATAPMMNTELGRISAREGMR